VEGRTVRSTGPGRPQAAIATDGRTVAFPSEATNVSPEDTAPDADAYVAEVP
jgi:hypothetical protein